MQEVLDTVTIAIIKRFNEVANAPIGMDINALELAKAAIDALNIIVLPLDAKPIVGDIIEFENVNMKFTEYVTSDTGYEWEKFAGDGNFSVRIVDRNGKAVKYNKSDE